MPSLVLHLLIMPKVQSASSLSLGPGHKACPGAKFKWQTYPLNPDLTPWCRSNPPCNSNPLIQV